MNIYNVTYPMKSGTMTVITIAKNGFDAQKQMEIKTRKGIKKVLGMKGVKCVLATDAEIQAWVEMLESIDDQHQLAQIRQILERRAS